MIRPLLLVGLLALPAGCGPSTLEEATTWPDIRGLIEGGALQGRSELVLRDRGLGPELPRLLAERDDAAGLRVLDLRGNGLGAVGLTTLVGAPQLAQLEELRLGPGRTQISGSRAGDSGARALAASTLPKLHTLDLGSNNISEKGAEALGQSSGLPSLSVLVLDSNTLGDAGAAGLLGGATLPPLTELHLGWNELGPAAAAAIAGSQQTRQLQVLLLSSNPITDAGATALAESAQLATVQKLYLSNAELSDAGVMAIAESEHLRALTHLNLDGNAIGDAGAQAILDSPHLSELQWLSLRDNPVGEALTAQLKATFKERLDL